MLTVNSKLLAGWTLTAVQKVLLRHNSSAMRNKSCARLTKWSNGHYGDSLSADIPFYRAFDSKYSMDYAERKGWFMTRWAAVNDDPYWKAPDISVPLLDLHDPCKLAPFWD